MTAVLAVARCCQSIVVPPGRALPLLCYVLLTQGVKMWLLACKWI
ncbi:MAG TPA: hypothetical protein VK348_09265 [Planctomycetota bacterium]|nr:hypothetical protein [Planctomycetota bacterium]